MPELIDISRLPAPLAEEVRKAERARLLREDTKLTYQEAAKVYDVPYMTLRSAVHEGILRCHGDTYHGKWFTHAAMREFVSTRLFRKKMKKRRGSALPAIGD